jgi:Domain of Unknown Function (DUF748)
MNRQANAGPSEPEANRPASGGESRRPRKHHGWRTLGIICLVLAAIIGGGRLFLPRIVRHYVNRTLDRNLLYAGSIGKVDVHLIQGAYAIHDVRISKRTGEVPVPLLSAKRVAFSIQWAALVHGKIVGQFELDQPELNFVAGSAETEGQTGAGGPWLEMIQDLFPFKINSAIVKDGSVHFRAYKSKSPVDVHLTELNASIDDLSNIQDQTQPLIASVQAKALVMGTGHLQFKMKLDPSSYHPTFHMALRLLGLNVTELNPLSLAYGDFDFKHGFLDLILEADAKEGFLTGYVKPLFRDLTVFSIYKDIKQDTVLQFFIQALMGGITSVFKNVPHNQFGTLIPFTGDLSSTTSANLLAAIGNLLRNAFVRAYLPRLQPSPAPQGEQLHFDPPSFVEALLTTDVVPR